MAETGTREIVGDPLALNAREQLPARELPLSGVRGNNSTNNRLFQEDLSGPMSGLKRTMQEVAVGNQDAAITEGKVAFMSGVTELQMREKGDYYQTQGYETLNASSKASSFFANEMTNMETEGAKRSPEEYQAYLKTKNKELFDSLPDDPAVRKLYVAAWDQVAPRLAGEQVAKHSAYNYQQKESAFEQNIQVTSATNADTPRRNPGSRLAISDTVVDTPKQSDARDRDIGIKTMLGEAGSEGEVGLAAVAHVLKNRSVDSRWGGSIADVSLAPKQFSTWNKGAGGNNPGRFRPGTAAYEEAGRVYDAVMAGRTVDPTGGATHYYSPAGMRKLVNDGDQGNLIPKWLKAEAAKSGGEIRIGGHIFVGRADGKGTSARKVQGPSVADIPNDAGDQDPLGTADSEVKLYDVKESNDLGWDPDAPHEIAPPGIGPNPGDVIEANMNSDPNAVAAEAGIATAETTPKESTELQATLIEQAAQLKPGRAAKIFAKQLALELSQGNTKLLDASGGIGMIYKLGGDADDARIVQSAMDRYENDQDKQFNESTVLMTDQLYKDIEKNPDMDLQRDIMPRINQMLDAKLLTQSGAKALADQVSTKLRTQDKKTMAGNPEFAQDMEKELFAFRKLDPTTMTEQEFNDAGLALSKRLIEVANKYGAPQTDIDRYVSASISTQAQMKNQAETQAKTIQAKAIAQRDVTSQIEARISRGEGVEGINGPSVKAKGLDGVEREFTHEEWYMEKVKMDLVSQAQQQNPEMDPDEAGPMIENEAYKRFIKAGVVDKKEGAKLDSAVLGGIFEKDGTVSAKAKEGFDLYKRIDDMDGGPEYLSKMLTPEAKMFYDSASLIYDASTAIDQSLRYVAEERDKVRTDPEYKAAKDKDFTVQARVALGTAVQKVMGSDGFWAKILPNDLSGTRSELMAKNTPIAQSVIARQADALQLKNPWANATVIMKQAVDQFTEKATVIGDNLIIASKPEERLDRVMGISDFGRDAPQQALNLLMDTDAPLEHWGPLWAERTGKGGFIDTFERWTGRAATRGLSTAPADAQRTHPYHVSAVTTANGDSTLTINLWKDPNKPEEGYIGTPLYYSAKDLGAYYKNKQNEPTALGNVMTGLREFFGRPDENGRLGLEKMQPVINKQGLEMLIPRTK